MPTPVSTFSPLTPFTPIPNSQGGGSSGYFDRPTNMSIPPHLTRRPDLGHRNSSSFSRASRLSYTSEGLRQPSENGWRIAFRMRDEAWSAWEKQFGSSVAEVGGSLKLSPKTLRLSRPTNPSYASNLADNQSPARRSPSMDTSKQALKPPRPVLQLIVPQAIPDMLRSADPVREVRDPRLNKASQAFDALHPNRNRMTPEITIRSAV